ncbi:hypothetical protein [Burkholderia lata]|uniref:hypothetical protein n=1 Tax=Burkholderia lata (strain ATCC 17760 / DSM 23089 / LMG 22485 / NCIMB 9086 / R18194 / 383) TaxID=482957 RepID=UPI00158364FF|nr:hypothetical protein [Burkholderia lata]
MIMIFLAMGAVTVIVSLRGQVHADEKGHAGNGVATRVTVIAMDRCERKRIPCTSPHRTKPTSVARDSQYIVPRRTARDPRVVIERLSRQPAPRDPFEHVAMPVSSSLPKRSHSAKRDTIRQPSSDRHASQSTLTPIIE